MTCLEAYSMSADLSGYLVFSTALGIALLASGRLNGQEVGHFVG